MSIRELLFIFIFLNVKRLEKLLKALYKKKIKILILVGVRPEIHANEAAILSFPSSIENVKIDMTRGGFFPA